VARGLATTIAVIALLAALLGCAGAPDDKAVQDTVKTYLDALAEGDGEKACDQLTGTAKLDAVEALRERLPELGASSCEDGLSQLAENIGEVEKDALRDPGEIIVRISGDSATAKPENGAREAELNKAGDKWLIWGGLF
jgi:hypothetical protein